MSDSGPTPSEHWEAVDGPGGFRRVQLAGCFGCWGGQTYGGWKVPIDLWMWVGIHGVACPYGQDQSPFLPKLSNGYMD